MARIAQQAVIEQLTIDGVEYVFGNPGTVEQGLIDEIHRSDISYVLALHEAVALAAADGYARAAGRLGVVQLHSSVGLGNGIGTLYQAKRGGSPLLVLVGEAGVAYDAMDSQMAADLSAMAAPVCKDVFRVLHPESTLRILRRAVQSALTAPQGPVTVILPADVMDAMTSEVALPTAVPVTRVAPADSTIAEAAGLLHAPGKRLILMGDGVARSGAQAELAAVAADLDADVYGVNDSEVNLDALSPYYCGQLGHMFGTTSSKIVQDAASVLVVGTYLFPEVFPSLTSPFAEGARVVHVDLDTREIGKNHPVNLGISADPALTLAALHNYLTRNGRAERRRTPRAPDGRPVPDLVSDSPLEALTRALAGRLRDWVVFDEALTSSSTVTRYFPPSRPGTFLQTRGGSLGVGIPGALGARLARPDMDVIAFTGDGGSMYTPQALWTAARHHVNAKFIICNNGRYQLLDDNIEQYWSECGQKPHTHPDAFDLHPAIGFAELAKSLGVPAATLTDAADADWLATKMLAHDGPFLVDARV